MKELLSNKSIRILNICSRFTVSKEEVTVSELMLLNKCSKRTVYDDIDYIRYSYVDLVRIEKGVHGYRSVEKFSPADLIRLKHHIYSLEPRVQIILNVFKHPQLSILETSDLLGISESNVRNYVRDVNRYLEKFQLCIDTSRFNGRLAYSFDNVEKLMYLLSEIEKITDENAYDVNKQEMRYIEFYTSIKTLEVPNAIKAHWNRFLDVAKRFEDGQYYEQVVASQLKRYHETKQILLDHEMELKTALPHFEFFEDKHDREYILSIMINTILVARLMKEPVDRFCSRYHYVYDDARRSLPRFMDNVDVLFDFLKNLFDIKVDYYVNEFVFHYLTRFRYVEKKVPLKAAVFSDLGSTHANSVRRYLNRYLLNIDIEYYNENHEYDLIITNTTALPSHITQERVIVGDWLTQDDLLNIFEALKNLIR